MAIGRIAFRPGRRGHWRRANRRMGKRPLGAQTNPRLLHDRNPLLLFVFLETQGWALFPILIILGFVALSTGPVVMAMVQESCPENRAFANGLYMGAGFALRGVAMLLLGIMADAYGLRRAFEISAILMLLGVVLVFRIPGKSA